MYKTFSQNTCMNLFRVLCLIFFALFLTLPVQAKEAPSNILVIQDDAELLTPEEELQVEEAMKPLTEFSHVAFVTVQENSLHSTKALAEEIGRKTFGNENGSLFMIDMEERYIYIYSQGENYSIVSRRRAEVITDNAFRYASKGDYVTCAETVFHQIHELMLGRKIAQPMKYLSNGILALLLALLINYVLIRKQTDQQAMRPAHLIQNFTLRYRKEPEISISRKPVRRVNNNYSFTSDYSSSSSSSGSSRSSSSGSSRGSGSSSGSRSSSSGSSHSSSGSSKVRGGGGGHKF